MQKESQLFNEEQRKLVQQAVIEAEKETSCEIVPVVATASGRYDRAEDIIGLWLSILVVITLWLLLPRQSGNSGSWDSSMPQILELLAVVTGIVVAFMAGAVAGSRIGWLRRLFTTRNQMKEEVTAKAREVFFDNRVHHTAGGSGLLIYVSLFERTAMVLGDQNILDKLGQSFLDDLCKQLTDSLRINHPSDALSEIISEAGRQLKGSLPWEDGDVNELHDALVLID